MIPKPIISKAFTLEDIRKIRDYDYEIIKDMNTAELIDYYDKGSRYAIQRIAELRRSCSEIEGVGCHPNLQPHRDFVSE
jgi:hypothetical protein